MATIQQACIFSIATFLIVSIISASPEEYRLLQDLKESSLTKSSHTAVYGFKSYWSNYETLFRTNTFTSDSSLLAHSTFETQVSFGFQNYDYFVRPTRNASLPLNVTDEKNQVMTIMAWLHYNWTDYKLIWDPEKYGGITDIRFSGADSAPAKLWKPDILLFNSVAEGFSSTYSSNFVVKHTGEVNQIPPGIFKFTCDIDITWFPFDDQLCFMKFGSWTHPGNVIDLDMDLATVETVINGTKVPSMPIRNEGDPQSYFVYDSVDRSVYVDNGEWSLLNTPGFRVVKAFEGVAYHELFFYIRIRRRTLAYGINLIIPSLLISLMTVLGFTLPPDACEKITLETTILLSVIFFLQMVANMTPPSSDAIPILSAFFSCCLLVVSTSFVFTVIVLNLHHRKPETHTMGNFMRYLLLDLIPYFIMLKKPRHMIKAEQVDFQNFSTVLPSKEDIKLEERLAVEIPCSAKCKQRSFHNFRTPEEEESEAIVYSIYRGICDACKDLNLINREFFAMRQQFFEQRQERMLESNWRFAAMVVDRLCLFLFTIFISVATGVILLPFFVKDTQ